MRVEAHIIAWNEIETIHLTIKHYQRFCDRITIYDNWSDDGTFEKAQESGCEVKRFGRPGILDDTEYIKIKNHCWKGSKADWVIVCDADEILWRPDILQALESALTNRCTIFNTFGWNVYNRSMPVRDFLDIQTGIPDSNYSKKVIFSPKIKEINYVFGCHVSKPLGHIRPSKDVIPLFHYRNIGGPKRLMDRHAIYRARMSEKNKRMGLGCHYTWDDQRRIKDWMDGYKASKDFDSVSIPGVVQSTV